jgi:O-antigen biosynthesis protein WbqP
MTVDVTQTQSKSENLVARRNALPEGSRIGKRAFDVFIALPALLLLSPVFAIIFLAIRLNSPGPALFRQRRVGRDGQEFTLLKFRTMHYGTPDLPTSEMTKRAVSPVTTVGKFLRRTSLDELPQLVNILRGEMSLVGPRPALPSQTLVNTLREQRGVHDLLPGITGWAQINGRDNLSDEEKVAHDAYYRTHISPGLDLKIILRTFLAVFTGQGNR